MQCALCISWGECTEISVFLSGAVRVIQYVIFRYIDLKQLSSLCSFFEISWPTFVYSRVLSSLESQKRNSAVYSVLFIEHLDHNHIIRADTLLKNRRYIYDVKCDGHMLGNQHIAHMFGSGNNCLCKSLFILWFRNFQIDRIFTNVRTLGQCFFVFSLVWVPLLRTCGGASISDYLILIKILRFLLSEFIKCLMRVECFLWAT